MAQTGEAAGYYNQQIDYNQNAPNQYPPPDGQQYQQPPPNYGQKYGPSGFDGGEKPTFDQAFKIEKPKFNDLWAAILFLIVCAGFVAVSGISIHSYGEYVQYQCTKSNFLTGLATNKSFNGGGIYGGSNDFGLDTNTIVLFIFCLASALVLSFAYVFTARTFPKTFIWVTGILNIVFGLVTALYMLSRRYWSGGIVFLLFSIFTIICFITWIPRIPFSALMLTTSVDVAKRYGHVWIVSFIGGLLATAFGAWYSVTLVTVYVKWEPGNNPACAQGGNCSKATVIGLLVFITFAAYWITEFLKNAIHTIISGVYGSWYFCSNNMPKGVTRGATRRALTYSFGSISFGSLIVAIINGLRQLCSIARQDAAANGNMGVQIAFCILGCLIGLLDWAVQFLNRYAYSYIALYGKSYIAAAKDTWRSV